MEGIHEPVDRAAALVLRRAVLDHVRVERRRWFPARLHVGAPGGAEEVFATDPDDPDEDLDHALRADVVAALIQRARQRGGAVPMLWLTRPGPLELQDVDAAWLSAARTAAAEAGIGLTLVVVTRRGWVDPRSGVRREWKRLRQR
ncbi:hypothetical protein [Nocardioides sp. T2.26MG-1]|uniref:hypothetical protein n=1 Tax=Nocardioides sp. T2.26MG-1 TaxID=3041166 RepID=UPI0024773233|nr:hypothetical protein [Nocardioides sp. T2.26MG-1]CAI9412954.1 hypothetical protein HIDPHFAB_01898 [Nocardioides sp. T2.26MG-1]